MTTKQLPVITLTVGETYHCEEEECFVIEASNTLKDIVDFLEYTADLDDVVRLIEERG